MRVFFLSAAFGEKSVTRNFFLAAMDCGALSTAMMDLEIFSDSILVTGQKSGAAWSSDQATHDSLFYCTGAAFVKNAKRLFSLLSATRNTRPLSQLSRGATLIMPGKTDSSVRFHPNSAFARADPITCNFYTMVSYCPPDTMSVHW
jgi:hypothetical protein